MHIQYTLIASVPTSTETETFGASFFLCTRGALDPLLRKSKLICVQGGTYDKANNLSKRNFFLS